MIVEKMLKLSAEVVMDAIRITEVENKSEYDVLASIIVDRIGNFKILNITDFERSLDYATFIPMIECVVTIDDSVTVDFETNREVIIEQVIMNSL